MKFTNINTEYHSKKANKGYFKNLYIKPFEVVENVDVPFLKVKFKVAYLDENNIEQIFESSDITFTDHHEITYIENENGELEDVFQFLQRGGVYDLSKIQEFNKPAIAQARQYFETDHNGELQFKETSFKQLAIDWSLAYITVEGKCLKDLGFQYQEIEE